HYQTVYAGVPGSVETPSAGRHLTWELLRSLRRSGVTVTGVLLHCSISSLQDDDADERKPLMEEWFSVDHTAAAEVNRAARVIAVGTSVVRALESSLDAQGRVVPRQGWTDLAITPDSTIHAVDALLTGLHEWPASHLDMLGAFVEPALLKQAYAEARDRGYLWHEFGDTMLLI
ncbi:MAG TPA: S-adenosylmethionine:tRNA ribosyltransferase-isomerase, partial [Candidatus Dormibacteraeota bacterium]|nr:S-adenosylmethionine:tRNA ribosyltransferase-isomerase [Candidatus Dormibacteraeota bacterium]